MRVESHLLSLFVSLPVSVLLAYRAFPRVTSEENKHSIVILVG